MNKKKTEINEEIKETSKPTITHWKKKEFKNTINFADE